MPPPPPRPTLFPYTTLFRSVIRPCPGLDGSSRTGFAKATSHQVQHVLGQERSLDRKSTRLNSSHLGISYAVFCLKKKKDTVWIARKEGLVWRVDLWGPCVVT